MNRLLILFIFLLVNIAFACDDPPVAALSVSRNKAIFGETLTLDATSSVDPDGGIIKKYEWDFDYDGTNFVADYTEYTTDGGSTWLATPSTDGDSTDHITTNRFRLIKYVNKRSRYSSKKITIALKVTDNDLADGGAQDRTDTITVDVNFSTLNSRWRYYF